MAEKKYKFEDEDGKKVELTWDEFVNRPFNSRLRILEDAPDYIPPKPSVDYDLNKDGVFDKKDSRIAGQVLAKSRKHKEE